MSRIYQSCLVGGIAAVYLIPAVGLLVYLAAKVLGIAG